jgi:hypothetical protein
MTNIRHIVANCKIVLANNQNAGFNSGGDDSSFTNLNVIGGGSSCNGFVRSFSEVLISDINFSGTWDFSRQFVLSTVSSDKFIMTNCVSTAAGDLLILLTGNKPQMSNLTGRFDISILGADNGIFSDLDVQDLSYDSGSSQDNHYFTNCKFNGTSTITLYGDWNKFVNCSFNSSFTLPATSNNNFLLLCQGVAGFTDNGTNNAIIDDISKDGTFTTNSDNKLKTEKSIKTYVDNAVLAEDFWDRAGIIIEPKNSGDTVKFDKLQGQTTATTFALDKLTFDTSVSAFTTITSSDTANVIVVDASSTSSAILRLDRAATNQNSTFEHYTAGSPKWIVGMNSDTTDDYHITGSGTIKFNADTDATIELGRAKISSPVTDVAYFSHYDNANATDYAIKQLASGRTIVNSKSGEDVSLAVNNAVQALADTTKFKVTNYINQQGIFAEIYVADNATSQSIPTGATYTKVTAFDTNGQSANCTADQANDKITITQTGRYRVEGSFSFNSGTANVVWRGAAFLNGTEQSQVHFKRKTATASDAGNAGFTGFIDVTTVPWDLDFRVRHDNAGSIDLTLEYANLNVEYVGET